MSLSRILAVAIGISLGAAGSAAADEWSYTDRVQQSQGIGQAGPGRQEAAAEAEIPVEASSFIARIAESQGIDTSGAAASGAEPRITSEATSFTSRVQLSQGIGEYAEGAAAGEPGGR